MRALLSISFLYLWTALAIAEPARPAISPANTTAGANVAQPTDPADSAETDGVTELGNFCRTVPAFFNGTIRFEKSHRIFHEPIAGWNFLEGNIQPNADIQVTLTANQLTINTESGLILSLAGMPLNITRLHYDNRTGDVHLESHAFGFALAHTFLESRMEAEIQKKFGAKLKVAFARMILIRRQNTLAAAGHMLNAVINVFKTRHAPNDHRKRGPPLPTFEGWLSLDMRVPADKSIRFGKIESLFTKGDHLDVSLLVRVPERGRAVIRGFEFSSTQGVHIHPANHPHDSLKYAILNSVKGTEGAGLEIDALNGVDGAISALGWIVGAAEAIDRGQVPTLTPGMGSSSGDHPAIIQSVLNQRISRLVSRAVTNHRDALLHAGATPALVNALTH